MSYYEDYDFDEMYYEPSIADDIFEEAKCKLRDSIKESIKSDLSKLESDNKSLKKENEELKEKLKDIEYRENQLKYEKENYKNDFEKKLMKGKFSEIFKDLEEHMCYYRIDREIKYKDKCDKCDNNREIHFIAPNGEDMTYSCDCNQYKIVYIPKKCELKSIFMTKDRYDKSKLFNFTAKYDYYSDYDEINVSIYPKSVITEFKEDLVCDFEHNQLFSTKEVCQKYCDELNKYEEYKYR